MDGNMPDGESIIRQFFYGQRFCDKVLLVYNEIFWLPGKTCVTFRYIWVYGATASNCKNLWMQIFSHSENELE